MAKFKLDKDHIQGFFFHHAEKLVLGVVLVLLVLFIWAGSGIAGLEASKTPETLSQRVSEAQQHISMTEKDTVAKKEEYAPVTNHKVRVDLARQPTTADPYEFKIPITPVEKPPVVRRTDPQIFKPVQAEATVVVGSLALNTNRATLWDALANMVQKTIVVEKKKPRRTRKKDDDKGDMGSMMMMMQPGDEDEDSEMMSSESMMKSMGGMMSGGGMAAMGGGGSPGAAIQADEEKYVGYRPNVGTGSSGSGVYPRALNIVSVRVLIPHQQLWDEFLSRFANAEGYNPTRDRPTYIRFEAERAEVPADPNEQPQWKPTNWTEEDLARPTKFRFAGQPGEIADPRYLDPKLTMPLPPLLMRDLAAIAVHSKVPMRELPKEEVLEEKPTGADPGELGADTAGAPGAPGAPGSTGPGAPGMGANTGAMGSEMMMQEGMMEGGGGAEDAMASQMMGSSQMMNSSGMMSSSSQMMNSSGMMSSSGQMMNSSGMMGSSGQMMGGVADVPQAEFKMVRFFDYIPSGKKYIYRVRFLIEDPNHPQMPQSAPHDSILDQTVRDRLAKVAQEEQTKGRVFYLTSEWSDPTPPVSADVSRKLYVGGVTTPRMLDIVRPEDRQQKSGFTTPADGEATAKVMSVGWDTKYGIDLPAIIDSSRGALLNMVTPADVLDPITLTFKTITEHRLVSNQLVLDLRGGEALPDEPSTLQAPGEVVILDVASDGLIVRNELDDFDAYDLLAPPPPVVVEAEDDSKSEAEDMMMESMKFGAGADS